jgi:hypothetical protein
VPFGPSAARPSRQESGAMPAGSNSSDKGGRPRERQDRTAHALTKQSPTSQRRPAPRAPAPVVELAPPVPPSAQDFWTDAAAGVHDVLQGPDIVDREPPEVGPRPFDAGGLQRPVHRLAVGAAKRLLTATRQATDIRRVHIPKGPPITQFRDRIAGLRARIPVAVLVVGVAILVVAGAIEAALVKDAFAPRARSLALRQTPILSRRAHAASAAHAAIVRPLAHRPSGSRDTSGRRRTHRRSASSAARSGAANAQSIAAAPPAAAVPVSCCASSATQGNSTAVDYSRQSTATQANARSGATERPPGPTGRVSLIGAGTTPSG